MNKTPVSNRNVQGSLNNKPHVTEDSEATTFVHAVLGMDAQSGDGDLFGEHDREATGQAERVPYVPGDKVDQGEENPEGADET